jgi:hypothetical protein
VLITVTLGNGLKEIGKKAFFGCKPLQCIAIPNTVKEIRDGTFIYCLGLSTVTVGKGVEEIGEEAFAWYRSLQRIIIPNAVKWIHEGEFKHCWRLMTVTLSNGREEIKNKAFKDCRSLEHIFIPLAVKAIDDSAFKGCSNLTHVEFYKKIEQFVSCEAMCDWWNQGLHEKSLSTYCFLVKSNIPDQLGLVQVKRWQANIYIML